MIHIIGGIVKVLGPNAKAPMNPRRSPKNCDTVGLMSESGAAVELKL